MEPASSLWLFYTGSFCFIASDGVKVNNFVSQDGQK